jgi:two-component system sensor histidine kinase VicK
MPRHEKDRPPAGRARKQTAPCGAACLPVRPLLVQVLLLLVLASGTTWLLQREALRDATVQATARAQAQTELIAQAIGDQALPGDGPRMTRILECAVREGNLRAAAIVDSSGRIVAHTDLTRVGRRLPAELLGPVAQTTAAQTELFGAQDGEIFERPLLGPHGPRGRVALLQHPPQFSLWGAATLRILLPAGLLLLAFIGVTQATIRWAVRPTVEFIERLRQTLDAGDEANSRGQDAAQGTGAAMEQAVSCVTALHQAKQALTVENRVLDYEKRRMSHLLDRLPDGILYTDAVHHILFSNRAADKLIERSPDTEGNWSLAQLPIALQNALREAHKQGQAVLPAEEDRPRRIQINRLPLPGGMGEPAGDLYILRDVSALQAAQDAQAEFLSQISHELKAPLNTIVTFVEALADGDDLSREEREQYFNTLEDESGRMARLIGNLMQLSRIQLGNLSGKFTYVKPAALLRRQLQAFASQAESAGITLRAKIPENLPALYGDKDLLGVAVTNLVSNAVKYTVRGGQVTLQARNDGERLTIEIEDTGIGIPAEIKEQVFERFVRSEQPEVRERPGSGLGLALVKEIAELHQGEVSLQSEVGRGSLFRLTLPTRQVGTRMDVAA